jgi:hypothetical protein
VRPHGLDHVAHALLVAGQIEERHPAAAQRHRDRGHDGGAQLRLQPLGGHFAQRAEQPLDEGLDVVELERIRPERAQPHRAKIGIAHRHRLAGAPLQARLLLQRKEHHVGLEGRFEAFVPVHQVGQDRQVGGVERVQPGAEIIGQLALVEERCDLVFAHRQLRAVLDLVIRERHAPGQLARAFEPFYVIDQLFLEKIEHGVAPVAGQLHN